LNSNQSSTYTPRKKKVADKYVLNNSSTNSNTDDSFSNSFNLENKFFAFEQSYKQPYLLSKGFVNIKSSEFNKKIDEFFEKEQIEHNKLNNSEFAIEAIIERVYSDSNTSKSWSSSNNVLQQNMSNSSDLAKRKYSFIIITNSFLYDLEYQTNENGMLTLKRKILLLSIELFSITSDLMRLILHVNSKLDSKGNFGITHENSIQIAFCLANMIHVLNKNKKLLFVVPKSKMLVDKIKYISSLEKYKEVCNQYSSELYRSLGHTIPHDSDETLLKLIPLSKIESKFTEVFCDKLLIITNKKIIELNSEFVDKAKIAIIPFNNLKKMILHSKSHKLQFYTEEDVLYQYSSIYARTIFEVVRTSHSKECLSELKAIKY